MSRKVILALVASALGFFVDMYDIIIFSAVRRQSLMGIGITSADDILSKGVVLINAQMAGMLIGGFLWGMIGDKKGRLSVLFGSIIMYSLCTFLNGFVTNFEQYFTLRFLAGVGLAGELGAGIALVSEQIKKEMRGYGVAAIGSLGMFGAVLGAYVGGNYDWRIAYYFGGILGFLLLFLRMGVVESGMFKNIENQSVKKGDIRLLLFSKRNLIRYVSIILVGFPGWFITGILITFTPEISKDMGMTETPSVATVLMIMFTSFAFGDVLIGLLSQYLKSRKKAIYTFMGIATFMIFLYFTIGRQSTTIYYSLFVGMGISAGYTITLLTLAAEQFGTNVRTLVGSSAVNLIRASVIPMTLSFQALKGWFGIANSAILLGVIVLSLAFWSMTNLEETFGKDLDFVEE
jgi:MFS transporter, putative metabolite:H+ symporter